MDPTLKQTPFYTYHQNCKARFAPFAGWEMPIQYERGALAEHKHVREKLGVFDTSHMGRFELSGPDAAQFLDYVVSSDILHLGVNESRYGLLCQEDGGVIDDVFVYRLEDRYLIVVNASNVEKDYRHLQERSQGFSVELVDRSAETVMLAVQGPQAVAFLDLVADGVVSDIARFGAADRSFAGIATLVGRTGYTGEDGVELFFGAQYAQELWEYLFGQAAEQGFELEPIGLAARDSLRFEPGFALYGHELSEEVSPVEARLTWACELGRAFLGRDAIVQKRERGAGRRLTTLVLRDKGVPREGCNITVHGQETVIGVVVSGMYAPTVDAYAANAYLEQEYTKLGTLLEVDIRGRRKTAEVVKRPLYTPSYR